MIRDTFDSDAGATRSWPEARADGAPVTCLRCAKWPTDDDPKSMWCRRCYSGTKAGTIGEHMADRNAWHAHRASLASPAPPTTDARDELLEEASRLVVMLEAMVRMTPMNALYKNTFAESSVAKLLADYRALRGGR